MSEVNNHTTRRVRTVAREWPSGVRIDAMFCIDREIRCFEGQYPVADGMTYNSYIVSGTACSAVLDTVDHSMVGQWLDAADRFFAGCAHTHGHPDYLIVQHLEPDHSAGIGAFMERWPECRLVCSAIAARMLPQFCPSVAAERVLVVKEGDSLDLGVASLRFISAPMVHWPEVMMTYVPEEKVLFSADAFGKFGTLDVEDDWATEARRYYFNIVGKYGMQVQNALKKLSGLEINVICPLHGPILTENLGYYLNLYNTWSSYQPEEDGVLIAYATIYGHTKEAAYDLKKMIEATGQKVKILELNRVPVSVAIGEAFRYSKLVLMSSSYDAGVFPAMELFLLELSHKNFQNRKVAIVENGSWAPSAGKTIKSYVEKWKNIDLVEPVITIRSKAKKADEEKLEALAKTI